MKTTTMLAAALIGCAGLAHAQTTPVGLWKTIDDETKTEKSYVRIVEAGSLSAAAQQLGTTQPTVSRRLQQLERLLGRERLRVGSELLGVGHREHRRHARLRRRRSHRRERRCADRGGSGATAV